MAISVSSVDEIVLEVKAVLGVERGDDSAFVVGASSEVELALLGGDLVEELDEALADGGAAEAGLLVGPWHLDLVDVAVEAALGTQVVQQLVVDLVVEEVLGRDHVQELHHLAGDGGVGRDGEHHLHLGDAQQLARGQERASVVGGLRLPAVHLARDLHLRDLDALVGDLQPVQSLEGLVARRRVLVLEERVALRLLPVKCVWVGGVPVAGGWRCP